MSLLLVLIIAVNGTAILLLLAVAVGDTVDRKRRAREEATARQVDRIWQYANQLSRPVQCPQCALAAEQPAFLEDLGAHRADA